jgi:N-acetylneuraminic acid mutarotase
MATRRQNHTATLLQSGKVLVAGGYNGTNAVASAEVYDPATGAWTSTGPMTTNRYYHTATCLPNGTVLVAGGKTGGATLSSTELFDPATGKWTKSGALNSARYFHTATLLLNGQVLVAGGYGGNVLSSAELYDPATGKWTATNAMSTERGNHTATLLHNGQVLVAGGWDGVITNLGLSSVELYDPSAGTWAITNSMNVGRQNHTATLLPNGKVLITGGSSNSGITNSAELYDPAGGTWESTGPLTVERSHHTANLLPNGQVLVAGGASRIGITNSSELYDPASRTWSVSRALNTKRAVHTATLLFNGKVLVAGGNQSDTTPVVDLSSTELYEYASGLWTNTGALNTARSGHTATLLATGNVLVAGGSQSFGVNLSSAELYDPTRGTWAPTGSMTTNRYNHTATLLPNGKVLVVGGGNGVFPDPNYLSNAEVYDPITRGWVQTGKLITPRASHKATLLPNGKVLVTGGVGFNYTNLSFLYLSSAELYDPATETWTVTGALGTGRENHTASLLPNGRVVVAGGYNYNTDSGGNLFGPLASAELYDPSIGRWTATGALGVDPRDWHTATLLWNRKVLVAAGDRGSSGSVFSAELFDPATETWTAANSLATARYGHAATMLPNGKVLVEGGYNSSAPQATAELYDPEAAKWVATSALSTARYYHTATLLLNGTVLVAGGYGGGGYLSSAELYDVGLGFDAAWQPQIATVTSPLGLDSSLVLTGSRFRGISGASGGNSQDSSADHPLVQLRSLESGYTVFLTSSNWSANSLNCAPVNSFPPGYALATVFVNGIPSTSSVINISVPIPTSPNLTGAVTNGVFQFAFTNSVGALFGVLAATNVALPLTNWTVLGGIAEIAPGKFQFTDAQAPNGPQRFYRVRAP